MSGRLVISGTDTGVGKTVVAAALVGLLDADYWKPIQAGRDGGTDRDTVARLSGANAARLHPEAYSLATAASPHRAAEIDGLTIDSARLTPPRTTAPLVIEGAGGLMVPLTRDMLQIDLFATWGLPVVLVAATRLGTINHTLLSLEALASRRIPIAGVLFAGDENADSQRTILAFGNVPGLGRLPLVTPLNAEGLQAAAREHLDVPALQNIVRGVRS